MWPWTGSGKWAGGASRWKKTPEVIAAIERLLEPDTAGDPISGLRWTHRTTAKIAAQLLRLHIRVSTRTVARLLRKLRFRLRVNRKKIGPSHPLREAQFAHIGKLRRRFCRQRNPVISVDAKKRELVGNFKNADGATRAATLPQLQAPQLRASARPVRHRREKLGFAWRLERPTATTLRPYRTHHHRGLFSNRRVLHVDCRVYRPAGPVLFGRTLETTAIESPHRYPRKRLTRVRHRTASMRACDAGVR